MPGEKPVKFLGQKIFSRNAQDFRRLFTERSNSFFIIQGRNGWGPTLYVEFFVFQEMTLMKWNRIPATCLAALLLFAGCSTEPSAQAENEDAAGSTSISSNLETEDLDSEDPETIDAR